MFCTGRLSLLNRLSSLKWQVPQFHCLKTFYHSVTLLLSAISTENSKSNDFKNLIQGQN